MAKGQNPFAKPKPGNKMPPMAPGKGGKKGGKKAC